MSIPTHHPIVRERLEAALEPLDLATSFDRLTFEVHRGDHDLAPGWRADQPLTPAAVLVPIVDRPGALSVMLTTRTPHLAQHGGQVSFPGGRVEPGDRSPLETALRETHEEIGLPASMLEPAGLLTPYETVTGFLVVPIVAFVSPEAVPRLDPHEVAEVFEIPLATVLDGAHFRRGSSVFRGERRAFYFLANQPRFIWGATAGILRDLWARYSDQGWAISQSEKE